MQGIQYEKIEPKIFLLCKKAFFLSANLVANKIIKNSKNFLFVIYIKKNLNKKC